MKGLHWPDTATDRDEVGGKAASLAALVARGFDVPPFFALGEGAFDGDSLSLDISGALSRIGPGPFAVRSSGVDEDGTDHSHAGQFDTLLNVLAGDVPQAAMQVRRSGMGATVETYRKTHGLAGGAPAVLVQRMVDARVSGVSFSADPVSGRRDRIVLSATPGLGDKLVSGEIDGETWRMSGERTVVTRPDQPVLSDADAREVAELAKRAEVAFGTPQDIEWAFEGRRLYLLQSRAITTPLRPLPRQDTALVVLDNSNIVESYPGLVSPLTYSFAQYSYDRVYQAFVRLLGLPERQIAENASVFANLLSRVDGRVYYNLGNWYRALALLPGFQFNREFMETMMGVAEPLPAELTDTLQPEMRSRLGETARMTWVALGLLWQAVRLPRTRARFMQRLDAALASASELEQMTPTQLAALYRRIEADLLDRWDAPLINDFLCMIGFGASRKLLERWGGEAGLAFHNDIMIGQGGIVSAEPAARIAAMSVLARELRAETALAEGIQATRAFPELQAGIDAYLARFGDRCTEELKLESIPLTEDPTPLLAAIRAGAMRGPQPETRRSVPDWRALLPGPVRRITAQWICAWAAARVRDRENLRFERTRIFGLARRVFARLGDEFFARGWLNDPRDIYHLTVAEVLGTVEGTALSPDLAAIAALRATEIEAAAARPDPPERITLRGPARPAPGARPEPQAKATGDIRQGTGCSAGQVTAIARVIRDPRTECLEAGEILVARNTDPGWIAVFTNASAIVVERGSLLSHSAIVAREMGIPCVVGVADATHWVRSGEALTVDGATGRVTRP